MLSRSNSAMTSPFFTRAPGFAAFWSTRANSPPPPPPPPGAPPPPPAPPPPVPVDTGGDEEDDVVTDTLEPPVDAALPLLTREVAERKADEPPDDWPLVE